MKLWKSLKVGIGKEQGSGPGPGSPTQHWGPPYELDVFKSASSLSTDSGLCTERGLRRAHVELVKPPGRSFGIKLAGRPLAPLDEVRQILQQIETQRSEAEQRNAEALNLIGINIGRLADILERFVNRL